MENEIKSRLNDIQRAIAEINSFVGDKKDFLVFQRDLKTQRAVERNIEVIGEAVAKILSVEPGFQLTHARKIVDTRNRIIHGYDSVSADIVWAIVVRDIPSLETEIKGLII